MDDTKVVVMEVAQRLKDLLGVSLYDAFVQRSKVSILRLERVWHQLHIDLSFILFLSNDTPVILHNMLVFQRSEEFELRLELVMKAFILDADDLDRHLWRQHHFII